VAGEERDLDPSQAGVSRSVEQSGFGEAPATVNLEPGPTTGRLSAVANPMERTKRSMLESPKGGRDQDWRTKAYSPSVAVASEGREGCEAEAGRETVATPGALGGGGWEGREGMEAPEGMPTGSTLELVIISNWGDEKHVGLSGLDVFDACGRLVTMAEPENESTQKLTTWPKMTCDASHMWLEERSTVGDPVTVTLRLATPSAISMMRIWNYNHSRVHATRGVREMAMRLDGLEIFRGEVALSNAL